MIAQALRFGYVEDGPYACGICQRWRRYQRTRSIDQNERV